MKDTQLAQITLTDDSTGDQNLSIVLVLDACRQ
jgi:hypothetical protein